MKYFYYNLLKNILLIGFLATFISCSSSEPPSNGDWIRPAYLDTILSYQAKSHHRNDGTFQNNYITREVTDKSFLDFMKFATSDRPEPLAQPSVQLDSELLKTDAPQARVTWLGHSAFLIQLDTINILTDPQFSEYASPVQWTGPKRYTPMKFEISDLPQIHYIIVSHDHYDHLDEDSFEALFDHHSNKKWIAPKVLAGLGMKEWFEDEDIHTAIDLDWWQERKFPTDSLSIWAVPVQHWSKRSLSDTHSRLWCGFVIQWKGKQIYFGGDQGYSKDTQDVGKVFGSMDLSLLPIGAYEPRWFMKNVHANPTEAIQMHQDLKSKLSLGMHWGTFVLTLEPVSEPPMKLSKELFEQKISRQSFRVLKHHQSLDLQWFEEFNKKSQKLIDSLRLKNNIPSNNFN